MNSTTYRFGVVFTGDTKQLARSAKDAEQAMKLVGERGMSEYRRMVKARETLGIRSEREIQREIHRTEAAYNRLARSGTMSLNEQRLAARKLREEVTRLTNEMGRMTTQQKLAFGARTTLMAAGGLGVAAAVAKPAVGRAMDYERDLAHLANTTYSNRDLAGRKAGMRELDKTIVQVVREGGGTRDQALGALNELVGPGIFNPAEIHTMLGAAVKASTASGADATDFAKMAVSAKQTLGVAPDRMAALFSMGTYAGQQGGFEIADMARHLPAQMAAAKQLGLYGEAGFAKLAALNQAAAVTAGTRDEAGNNVLNLLAKLGSVETAKNFKAQGVDLTKEFAEGRMKGFDALDVLGNVLSSQLGKDKNYQSVQDQLKNAKNDEERSRALQAVGDIAQGTLFGKVIQDRQALMGLISFIQERERVNQIAKDSPTVGARAVTDNLALIRETSSFKAEALKNEALFAQTEAIGHLTPAIDSLTVSTARLVKEYPLLTTSIGAATVALFGLATSAAAAGALFGGRGPGLPRKGPSTGGRAAKGLALLGLPVAAAAGSMYGMHKGLGWVEDQMWKWMTPARSGRGVGFDDPRRLDRAQSLSERLQQGNATGASAMPLLQVSELQGAIDLNIKLAPGLFVDTQAQTNNPRIPFRTDVGKTNLGAGF